MSSQEVFSITGVQSFVVIQRPNARQLLSLMPRVLTFLVSLLFLFGPVGFARIVKWSDDAILGSWRTVKSFGLFVKNQSRVFDSLVLKVINCLRWLGNVRCVCFNPVEFGLKSPVITTRAFGYFLSMLSRLR